MTIKSEATVITESIHTTIFFFFLIDKFRKIVRLRIGDGSGEDS